MFDAGKRRKLCFQLRHLRPEDPLPAFDGLGDRAHERLAQALARSLQINEGNGVGHGHLTCHGPT